MEARGARVREDRDRHDLRASLTVLRHIASPAYQAAYCAAALTSISPAHGLRRLPPALGGIESGSGSDCDIGRLLLNRLRARGGLFERNHPLLSKPFYRCPSGGWTASNQSCA